MTHKAEAERKFVDQNKRWLHGKKVKHLQTQKEVLKTKQIL